MTEALSKAILLRLDEIKGTGKDARTTFKPAPNGAFEVQFNPTSLKITRSNNTDQGSATTKSQRRQNPSAQSATLAFDLEFDTAEGDSSGKPVDVRTRTLIVRQFAEPSKEKPKSPPPPLRFIWGTFVFQGIVTQLTEDLDYFSATGLPLRAKVSVTITEQNPDFEAKLTGAGSLDSKAATAPGAAGSGSAPGSSPTSNPVSAELAQLGESVQQLLTRLNADPATWRAAMAGLDSPLSLTAGAQVQLGAQVSAGIGLGASVGFGAGAGVSASVAAGAALGISAGAGLSAGAGFSAGVAVGAGFTLSANGGVAVSEQLVRSSSAAAASAASRAAFEVPTAGAGLVVGASVTVGGSVVAAAGVTGGQVSSTSAVRAAVTVDPRTQSFGASVPLRPRVTGSASVSAVIRS